ncbi:MAG: hypothetical protein JWP41_4432 [Ramlibacter sp.]|nr:hypothetical protein [Ramlibacter sp.]
MSFSPSNWSSVFALETPLLELLARALLLYSLILFFLRVMPRRTGGELATMDLVLLLLIAEAASHSLGDYAGVGDGIFQIACIMAFNFALNALSFRFKWVEKLVSTRPIPIVLNGRMLQRNMRREFLTEEELRTYLRKNGIEDIENVKSAYIEGEGQITFITKS